MDKKRNFFGSLIVPVLLTLILGFAWNVRFSAYNSCRALALKTQAYDVWKHVSTTQDGFQSKVSFSDGYNDLTCTAIGIGPVWFTSFYIKTDVACTVGNPPDTCPEDYFGVEP